MAVKTGLLILQVGYSGFTPSEPVYNIFVPGNQPKTSSCQLPYQCSTLHSTIMK